jgi:hypothetical protein
VGHGLAARRRGREGSDGDRLERWAATMLAESDRFYALEPCDDYELAAAC